MEEAATPVSDEVRERASARIHVMARDARRAVAIQLAVAALALLATVIFGWRISTATTRLAEVESKLEAETKRLDATSRRVAFADDATRAVLGATAALATREAVQYATVIGALEGARANLATAADELQQPRDAAAIVQLRQVRMAVNGTLARVRFNRPDRQPEDVQVATQLVEENLNMPNLERDEIFRNTIALATFRCEQGEADAVKALLDSKFVAAYPQVGANGVLPDACRAMAGVSSPAVPAYDSTKVDPAYALRTVYMQIAAEVDRPWAAEFALKLCDAGYDVRGIERVEAEKVSKGGQVVYYYDAQASEAKWLASQVRAPWAQTPLIRRLVGFANLDRHTAEVWLPALARDAGTPANVDELRRFKRCLAKTRDADAVETLVAQLVSDNKQDRVSAGQSLADRVRSANDTDVIAALLGQLEGQQLDHLSAAGRLNVLYLLNVEASWADRPEKARMTAALAAIRTRSQTRGIAIGAQTADCMNKLADKLAGRPADDRCGGL